MNSSRWLTPAALLAAALALAHPFAAAQEAPAARNVDRVRIAGLPFVYYAPETTLAFGAGGVLTFRAGRPRDRARTSSVWAYGTYNLEKQVKVLIEPQIYLRGNDLVIHGKMEFERAPQRFYGLGDETAAVDREVYTPRAFTARFGVKRRLVGGLFGGLQLDFESTIIEKVEAGGLLASGTVPGSRGGTLAGLGASLDWDTRDAPLFPRRGALLGFTADVYGAAAGSEYTFSRFKLDLREYLPLGPDQVLALQGYVLATGGEVPFYKLALLGGDTLLRGYFKGRFRDKAVSLVQAEYRAFVSGRIGFAGFAGLAQVFPGLAHFGSGRLMFSIGTGLRYLISKRDGTTVRLDLAWGERSFGLYATAQEAF
jgi:hypothetical protein